MTFGRITAAIREGSLLLAARLFVSAIPDACLSSSALPNAIENSKHRVTQSRPSRRSRKQRNRQRGRCGAGVRAETGSPTWRNVARARAKQMDARYCDCGKNAQQRRGRLRARVPRVATWAPGDRRGHEPSSSCSQTAVQPDDRRSAVPELSRAVTLQTPALPRV